MKRKKTGIKRKIVVLSPWTHHHLLISQSRLARLAEDNPEVYPAIAGRRLTLSDVVFYLTRRFLSETDPSVP